MITISGKEIRKKFGNVQALNGITFEVNKGELFGIIGSDGAGKTTLLRILATLILADTGLAQLDGFDVISKYKEIRKRIGYMPGKFSLYPDLTVDENLKFFAKVFHTTFQKNHDLIKDIYLQIEPFKNLRAGKLSGGMKQKLALCCVLIHKPSILILDEPTTGVDAVSRKEFWKMLHQLLPMGITILVSTPYMDEASLCDRIALIRKGLFMEIDSPKNLLKKFSEVLWAVQSNHMSKLLTDLRESNLIKTCFAFGEMHHIAVKEEANMNELKNYLSYKGHSSIEIHKIEPSIEDCYMQLEKMKQA